MGRSTNAQPPEVTLPADVTTPFYDALLEDDVDTLRDLLEKTPTLVRTLYTEAAYYPDTEASAVSLLGPSIGPLSPLQLACLMECPECALEILKYCRPEDVTRRTTGDEEDEGEAAAGDDAAVNNDIADSASRSGSAAEHSSAQTPDALSPPAQTPSVTIPAPNYTSMMPPLSPAKARRRSIDLIASQDDSGEEWSDDDESPYGDSTPPSVDDDEELLSSSWHRAMHMKDGPDHDDPHKVVNLHWDPTFREVAYDKNAKPTKSILLKESRKTDRHIRFQPLYEYLDCARTGDTEKLRRFIEQDGLSVNAQTLSGIAPLHYAAEAGNAELMSYLVDRGADVQLCTYLGWSPLHYASWMGHVDACRYLLSKGANPHALTDDDETPLDVTESDAVKAFFAAEVSPAENSPAEEHAVGSIEAHGEAVAGDAHKVKQKKPRRASNTMNPRGAI